MKATREEVAKELDSYLHSIGLDDPWSEMTSASSRWRYAEDGELYSAARLEFHTELIDAELAKRMRISRRNSLGVIVTAGPPGAGKSTALAADPTLAGFRDIDADVFKDGLLVSEQTAGNLYSYLDHLLPDENPVALRELSGYVHAESTTIANSMRERCLSAGENVVVHGTLSSLEYTDELLQQLDEYGYSRLIIFDVETTADMAIDQALGRWWTDRVANADGLGGRFVSPDYIRRQYSPGQTVSNCAANAVLLRDRATKLGWSVELRPL